MVGLALFVPQAAAQTQSNLQINARAGFEGSYRSGEWFPIVVDIANDGPDVRGELEWQLPGQRNEQSFRYPVDLPRGSRKRITLTAFSRGFARSGQIRLIDGDVVLADTNVVLEPVDADRFVIGVVSSDPTLLNSLETLSFAGSNGTLVRHLQAESIPDQALALRGLNALFLHDTDSSKLSARQQEAIRLWAALGGQLIVSGGTGGQAAASGIADILPAEIGSQVSDGDISGLLQLGKEQLPSGATRAPLANLHVRAGANDTSNGAQLIYTTGYGAGSTTVTAFDFALLRGWQDEPTVWEHSITSLALFAPANGSRTNQTSLIQAGLQLPGLGLPSTATLLIFLLGYVLVIGPLNYLVLRRLRRLEWAWVSVPLIVSIFAGGLYLVGFGLRGNQSQLSQITVVQASEGQNHALATGFVALFSPRRETFTIGFPPETLIHETRGFDDVAGGITPVVVSEARSELRDVLVDIASIRTFVGEAPIDQAPLVESHIQVTSNEARGEIRNASNLALDNVIVVRGGMFVDLGSLAPGVAANFDFAGAGRNFPWAVTIPESGIFNRKTLINTLFNGESTLYSSGTGPLGDTGVYMIAWSNRPSMPIQINNLEQSQQGYTLYVVRLRA